MIANKFAILLFVVVVVFVVAADVVFITIIVVIAVVVAVPVLAYRCTVYHYALFFSIRAILCLFHWIWLFFVCISFCKFVFDFFPFLSLINPHHTTHILFIRFFIVVTDKTDSEVITMRYSGHSLK